MSAMLDLPAPTVLRTEAIDSSPPGGAVRDRARFSGSTILLGLSLAMVWTLVYLTVLSGFEQAHTQHGLYQQLRSELAEGTAPTAAPIPTGDPVALLSVPEAGIDDLVVVEGSRPAQLQDGPGHVLSTVLPGQVGLTSIAGKSLSFGAPFKRIGELGRGDSITVTTQQGVFAYQVIGPRRDGDPVPAALLAGDQGVLTLLSADRGAISAGSTLYVDAVLVGDPAVAGTRAASDPDARLMESGTDVTTLALLVLALQLFVGALAAFSWAWHRWSPTATWIAVGPCVLGAAWLVSTVGTRLLPGLV
ncbi:class E sortase [Nocardioides rubriscoriae]|uniref:class E sortase n=1 Tax=Nocardioides rubriscoriae TaxID=642762 RepID=UPI0011E04A45|nr:class E sortase [Nocardioides rubriscoriae]